MASENEKPLIVEEDVKSNTDPDPQEVPIKGRKLYTQPYDLVVGTILDQVEDKILFLRPLSDRPSFQRRYVWTNSLASKLIESILLNVPIPQCYLSQNNDFELDVIDGQQRIYSIFRFVNNQFKLMDLDVLKDLNGKQFYELPIRLQKQINTFVLRCVVISNDSDPEIRFNVFERLNTNTVPLNTQELRNCMYRGSLITLVNDLAENEQWLQILGRKEPDKRMRGEELILRFFALNIKGLENYRTPQKLWLNSVAEDGRKYSLEEVSRLKALWMNTINKCLIVFEPNECFRRLPLTKRSAVINLALMDLTMHSLSKINNNDILNIKAEFKNRYLRILNDDTFTDLITRAVDHRKRTIDRFELWNEKVNSGLID